ncbi:hypothetical protein [Flindersiella endophytica]
MTDYPTPPPIEQPGPAMRPERPASVTMAVRLMYAGGVLSILSLLSTLLMTGQIRDAAEQAAKDSGGVLSQSQIDAIVTGSIIAALVFGLIGAGLWFLMAWQNGKGANWARIVGTVFFGIETLSAIYTLAVGQGNTAISMVLLVLIWLVGLAAVIFMWRPESSEFYKAASARP